MIDGEAELEAVRADLAAVAGRANAGVVDQDVDPVGFAARRFREFVNLRERGEVGLEKERVAASLRNPFDDLLPARPVVSMYDHARGPRSRGARRPDGQTPSVEPVTRIVLPLTFK